MSLPYKAEWHRAQNKQWEESILLVPFFRARRSALSRHVQWLNKKGYDVLTFRLYDNWMDWRRSYLNSRGDIGMKHLWADQIERLLNEMPGQKIIFSFSNPCSGAIEALARRKAQDVSGLICDSGPTSEMWTSMINYLTHEEPLTPSLLKWPISLFGSFAIAPNFKKSLFQDCRQLPSGFPILSIRGWKDKLIPPQHIDAVFEPHAQIEWQKLSLPKAGHLNGLKDFREDYEPAVQQFLSRVSSKT